MEGSAAESTSAEDDGESGGEWTRNSAKKAKRGLEGLEVGGANAPAPSFPKQRPPLRARRAPLRARRTTLQTGRALKAKEAARCLRRIHCPLVSRHPIQVAGKVMPQRERTNKCFRRGNAI